jgi:hypothetical protein
LSRGDAGLTCQDIFDLIPLCGGRIDEVLNECIQGPVPELLDLNNKNIATDATSRQVMNHESMIMMMEESGGSGVLPLLTSEIEYQQGMRIMRLLVGKRKSHENENDFNLDQDYAIILRQYTWCLPHRKIAFSSIF